MDPMPLSLSHDLELCRATDHAAIAHHRLTQRIANRSGSQRATMVARSTSGNEHGLSVSTITSIDQLQRISPEWLNLLGDGAVGHNVHNDPRMISHLLDQQPSLIPQILIVRRDAELICVAPFYVQPAEFAFEFSVWKIRSGTARSLRVFGESVILASHADAESCVAVIGNFLEASSDYDFAQIYGMNHSDRFWHVALQDDCLSRRSGWATIEMRAEKIHRVSLENSFEEYLAKLSASTRQTLRYSHRRFFNDDRVRLLKCTEPADVAALLQSIQHVYSHSWQAKTFGDTPRDGITQRALLERTAEEGWLRSYVLLRGEEPIAYQLGYQYNRVYYLLDCAYSQQSAAASPGSVLTFSVMEDLHAEGSFDTWDFGFGDMPYKRHFQSTASNASTVYFVPRNRWRRMIRLQCALNWSYDRLRNAFVRLRADRLIRKLIKRQK